MADPNATPDPKGEGAGSGDAKTYTQEEWAGLQSKYEKNLAAQRKANQELENKHSELSAKLETLEIQGKTPDADLVKLKTDYNRQVKQLETREREIAQRELKLQAAVIAKDYEVDVDELQDFKTTLEMENYALKKSLEKVKKSPAGNPQERFDRLSGFGGGVPSETYESLSAELKRKDVNKMRPDEVKDYLDKLIKASNAEARLK